MSISIVGASTVYSGETYTYTSSTNDLGTWSIVNYNILYTTYLSSLTNTNQLTIKINNVAVATGITIRFIKNNTTTQINKIIISNLIPIIYSGQAINSGLSIFSGETASVSINSSVLSVVPSGTWSIIRNNNLDRAFYDNNGNNIYINTTSVGLSANFKAFGYIVGNISLVFTSSTGGTGLIDILLKKIPINAPLSLISGLTASASVNGSILPFPSSGTWTMIRNNNLDRAFYDNNGNNIYINTTSVGLSANFKAFGYTPGNITLVFTSTTGGAGLIDISLVPLPVNEINNKTSVISGNYLTLTVPSNSGYWKTLNTGPNVLFNNPLFGPSDVPNNAMSTTISTNSVQVRSLISVIAASTIHTIIYTDKDTGGQGSKNITFFEILGFVNGANVTSGTTNVTSGSTYTVNVDPIEFPNGGNWTSLNSNLVILSQPTNVQSVQFKTLGINTGGNIRFTSPSNGTGEYNFNPISIVLNGNITPLTFTTHNYTNIDNAIGTFSSIFIPNYILINNGNNADIALHTIYSSNTISFIHSTNGGTGILTVVPVFNLLVPDKLLVGQSYNFKAPSFTESINPLNLSIRGTWLWSFVGTNNNIISFTGTQTIFNRPFQVLSPGFQTIKYTYLDYLGNIDNSRTQERLIKTGMLPDAPDSQTVTFNTSTGASFSPIIILNNGILQNLTINSNSFVNNPFNIFGSTITFLTNIIPGTYLMYYTVTTDFGTSNQRVLIITVTPNIVQLPPSAEDGIVNFNTLNGGSFNPTFNTNGGIFNVLTIISSNLSNANFSINGSTITFIPNITPGNYNLNYTITTNFGTSVMKIITVNISPNNVQLPPTVLNNNTNNNITFYTSTGGSFSPIINLNNGTFINLTITGTNFINSQIIINGSTISFISNIPPGSYYLNYTITTNFGTSIEYGINVIITYDNNIQFSINRSNSNYDPCKANKKSLKDPCKACKPCCK